MLQNLLPVLNLSAVFLSFTHLRREQGNKFLSPESESYWYLETQSRRWGMSFGIQAVFDYCRARHTIGVTSVCWVQNPHQGGKEQNWVQKNSKQLLGALSILIICLLFLIIYQYVEKILETTWLTKIFVIQSLQVFTFSTLYYF